MYSSLNLNVAWSPRKLLLGALAPSLVLLSGCNNRFGIPDPATKQGESVLHLWQFAFYTACVLGAIVGLVLLTVIIRNRRKDDQLPKQTEGNVPLEITYTVIPLIIVAVLFGLGLKAQAVTTALKKNPDLNITVTGYQWNWRFDYPAADPADDVTVESGPQDLKNEDTFPVMMLPANERVRLNLVAADVNHSFYVPGFLEKRDLIPGVHNQIDFTPTKTGTYIGHCAEFCGLNHSQMNFKVQVVQKSEFEDWLVTQRQQNKAGHNASQQTPTTASTSTTTTVKA